MRVGSGDMLHDVSISSFELIESSIQETIHATWVPCRLPVESYRVVAADKASLRQCNHFTC